MIDWHVFPDTAELAAAAGRRIAGVAQQAIRRHGMFKLVLAGGGTPLQVYRLLSATAQDWQRWELFYGDERCLPEADPDLNRNLVISTGLAEKVGMHHPINVQLGAQRAALQYSRLLEAAMPFDMVLLGMGEDGHTASLFPQHSWPDENVIAVHDAPKPPGERVSLSPAALRNCRQLLVLVSGAGKRAAVAAWRAGSPLPIARVTRDRDAEVLLDRAAAGEAF
jgi:6-phosphogluconolactonase